MTYTSQTPRTPIIIGGFISNHEGHVADLRAHANTASAERKAQSPKIERRERSTCVSGFPMKATSATRAVAWCSDGMLDDPQKSDSTQTPPAGRLLVILKLNSKFEDDGAIVVADVTSHRY